MFHLDPRFTGLVGLLFLILGIFNLYTGQKRLQILHANGFKRPWYKEHALLTGLEYVLLGLVVLINMGISLGFFSVAQAAIVIPIYIGLLCIAAAILGLIFVQRYQIRKGRQETAATGNRQPTTTSDTPRELTAEQRTLQEQHRRERRKKAAAARRRQSGRS
ncbi:hypothetical protein [Dictyobacter arantiisoli]|uniref:DUF3784 domain-containing protein n=1 Tax=Dictyobacter arantiisoli TaxID=2014874 RepID=A0A5A5THZ8_9CHLR|nr:hypothetical protein [Dictyobacter arantiisoli]GCF11007.1 hypothetical protein KDI_45710 [Dictyobacter arantiisoli]